MAAAKTSTPALKLDMREEIKAAMEGDISARTENNYVHSIESLTSLFYSTFAYAKHGMRKFSLCGEFLSVTPNSRIIHERSSCYFPRMYTQLFDYAAGHVFTYYDAETGGVSFINGVRQGDEKRLCIREAFNDLNPDFFKDVTDTACRIAEDLATGVTPETIRADARYFLDTLAPRWTTPKPTFSTP